jgi:hypothetical protein
MRPKIVQMDIVTSDVERVCVRCMVPAEAALHICLDPRERDLHIVAADRDVKRRRVPAHLNPIHALGTQCHTDSACVWRVCMGFGSTLPEGQVADQQIISTVDAQQLWATTRLHKRPPAPTLAVYDPASRYGEVCQYMARHRGIQASLIKQG